MSYDKKLFLSELLENKPFLKEFIKQYLDCLDDKEFQEFFRQFINSYDGSLDKNKNFYDYKPLIKRVNKKLTPTKFINKIIS